jgi:transcriptional regulator with XRE-family HTH domain
MWLDRINQMKKETDMTLEEISVKSKIAKGTLNKIFAGQTKDPQLSNIKAIVHALGHTLDDLECDFPLPAFEVSSQEQVILTKFRELPEQVKEDILDFIDLKHAKAAPASEATRKLV